MSDAHRDLALLAVRPRLLARVLPGVRKATEEVTDPTPPHDAEYREQRKFEALVQTATNEQLRALINKLTGSKNPPAPTWQISVVWQEINRRTW